MINPADLRMPAQDSPSIAELKAQVDGAATPVAASGEDPRHQESWTFDFTFTNSRGQAFNGRFTNKVMSIGEQTQIALLRAKLAGGTPYDQLDPETVMLHRMLAWMAYSLESRPEWATDFAKLYDIELVFAIWEKVVEHEDAFFRRGPATTSGSRTAQGERSSDDAPGRMVDAQVQTAHHRSGVPAPDGR